MSWCTEARGALIGARRARSAVIAAVLLAVALGGSAAELSPGNTPAATPTRLPAAVAPTTAIPACNEPLCYTATRLEAARNHIVLINIDIVDTTRGVTHLTADRAEATGVDFGNSHWVLTGHVRAYMPQGQLQADTATVQFLDKRIVSITANGAPAQFERVAQDAAQAGTPGAAPIASLAVHGHAQTVTYNVERSEVQLNGDSWLTDGCNEITSQRIVYDIASQSVQASTEPGGTGRVHGTIRTTHPGTSCTSGIGRP